MSDLTSEINGPLPEPMKRGAKKGAFRGEDRVNALVTSFKEGLKNEPYLSFIVTPSKDSLSCCEGFRKVCIFFRTNLYF